MRIYIIGNDGITLCREPPAAVNEGEIAFASSEELHTARPFRLPPFGSDVRVISTLADRLRARRTVG